jgi:Cu/Ag efflux protein CusF
MEVDSGQHRQITGTVTGIDIRNRTITVEKKNKNVILDINEKTTLTQCINNSSLTDIRIGDKVTVKYKEIPDKNPAKSVTIKGSAKNTD